jgi:CRISPR/Cas system-associated protein endoribonuclease Cas2
MLVLVTYDVNVTTVAGRKRLRQLPNSVLTMGSVFRTPSLNVYLILLNLRFSKEN